MVSQIAENLRMEKKIDIQNKVIKELKENMLSMEMVQDDPINDIEKLKQDIEHLENENKEKVRLLDIIHGENEVLKEKVEMEKERNEELEKLFQNTNVCISLNEEISTLEIILNCDLCAEEFHTKYDLNQHVKCAHETYAKKYLKDKLEQLEKEIGTRKLYITENLLGLNYRETNEKGKCSCKGSCRINHKIYNWRESECGKLQTKYHHITKITVEDSAAILKKCSQNAWGLNFLNLN